jgi:hypothetical protein
MLPRRCVGYTPSKNYSGNDTLRITATAIDDPDGSTRTTAAVSLNIRQRLNASNAMVFDVGDVAGRTIYLTNVSHEALSLASASLPVGFAIGGDWPTELAAGQTAAVAVSFTATASGTYLGTMEISTTGGAKLFSVLLKAIVPVQRAPALEVFNGLDELHTSNTIAFGASQIGQVATGASGGAGSGGAQSHEPIANAAVKHAVAGEASAQESNASLSERVLSYGTDFVVGLVKGFFVDGLKGEATGVWDAIKSVGSGISWYTRIVSDYWLGTDWFTDEEALALDRNLTLLEDFGSALKTHGGEIVQAILSGDTQRLEQYSPLVKKAALLSVSILRQIKDTLIEEIQKPETQGRVVGWVLSQVAVAVVTGGVTKALKAGALLDLAKGVDRLDFLPEKVKKVLADSLARVNCFINSGCFTGDTLVLLAAGDDDVISSAGSTAQATRLQIPIMQVALGSRVLGENPQLRGVEILMPEPDPQEYCRLHARVRRADNCIVEMEVLRPRAWVEGLELKPGSQFMVHYPELKIDGEVTVIDISPCPPIVPGDGQVVTGRFVSREIGNLVHVRFSDGTTLKATDTHPIWSADREDWIPAGELQPGERADSLADGCCTVLAVERVGYAPAVYNLEVHGQHVYRVAESAILVHNNNCLDDLAKKAPSNLVPGEVSVVPRTGPKGVDPLHHNANVLVVDAQGNVQLHTRIVSGNMTPAEKALGFPKNTLASHTEARAMKQVPLEAGETITITGQRPPCPSCKGAMNRAVDESGARIIYRWRENGQTQYWEAGSN